MKENDYVRTKTGVHKIFRINEKATVWKYDCDKKPTGDWDSSYEYIKIREEDSIKSSPNILELLEPMDLLYIDIDVCGGIVVPRIPETLDELKEYIEKIKSGEYILKYVVTHEQLENDMYKVGE